MLLAFLLVALIAFSPVALILFVLTRSERASHRALCAQSDPQESIDEAARTGVAWRRDEVLP